MQEYLGASRQHYLRFVKKRISLKLCNVQGKAADDASELTDGTAASNASQAAIMQARHLAEAAWEELGVSLLTAQQGAGGFVQILAQAGMRALAEQVLQHLVGTHSGISSCQQRKPSNKGVLAQMSMQLLILGHFRLQSNGIPLLCTLQVGRTLLQTGSPPCNVAVCL